MTNIEKYGFGLVRKQRLDELDCDLYELIHIKSGASLIYLDRDDENKSFSIGFATPPTDNTGVFHIIEHSVLCGSEKYPLNDPFAELLKGSLNTFLNAVTYEDRTIYPVSSRCERDFLNLVDVYMDAVLSPNLLKNQSIFHQEGWHYEYDAESDTLSRNGVVYNEMKGAYSSPDELGEICLCRALFGDTAYCCDSGGDPESIPTLTYEMVKEAHKKHYHPSNARIVLDGKMDICSVLSLLDSHLSKYDRGERISLSGRSIPRVAPITKIKYEIAENESEDGKVRLLLGYVYSDYADRDSTIAMSVLSDILCGSNASPLKKALLDGGLCKDAAMYSVKSRENTLVIEVRDIEEEKAEEIVSLVEEIIIKIAKEGVPKAKIDATLNSMEFRLRERDFGTLPTGIAFAMTMYGSWMWGGKPEDAILYNDTLASVREKMNGSYFEDMLLKITSQNPHRASLLMLPDKELGARSALEEKERLAKIRNEMTDEDIAKITDDEKRLRLWQQAEPTAEQIASLPCLTLDDIPEKITRPVATESELLGVKILRSPVKTNGIVYISLLFDASDICNEELLHISLLASALMNLPTESYTPLELQNEVKANLGSLFSSVATGNKNGTATPYFKIGSSALLSKTDDMVRLIKELTMTSRIEDNSEIKRLAIQIKTHIEDMIITSGETVALSRAEAGLGEDGAISEYMAGYEAYKLLSDICESDEKICHLTRDIADLLRFLMDRRRLTVFVSGDASDELLSSIISIFPEGSCKLTRKSTPPCADKNEFILTPSKVAYAVTGGKGREVKEHLGLMRVVRSILSYEYLWNKVRVLGGAYGTGFVAKKDGTVSFYSYRDPNPTASVQTYRDSSDYLRRMADTGEDITKFIIGSIGEYDTLITPRIAALITLTDYINGWTGEDEARVRREMLNIKPEHLRTAADIIDSALSDASTVIVGGQEHLDTVGSDKVKVIKI